MNEVLTAQSISVDGSAYFKEIFAAFQIRVRRIHYLWYVTPTFITEVLRLVTSVATVVKTTLSVKLNFFGAKIALLGWFPSRLASLQWPRPVNAQIVRA